MTAAREDLRLARLDLGLSQTALAEAAGVSRETIRRLESGIGGVHPGTAKKIGDALGLTPLAVHGLQAHEEHAA